MPDGRPLTPTPVTAAVSLPITVLGFDFGTRRIGVAVGNTLTGRAQPLATVESATAPARLDEAVALVAQWQPGRVVVGIPVHADGTPHAMTQRALAFACDLAARVDVPVEHADERHTTQLAQGELDGRRAGREGRLTRDAVAAQLILQGWLDARQ